MTGLNLCEAERWSWAKNALLLAWRQMKESVLSLSERLAATLP